MENAVKTAANPETRVIKKDTNQINAAITPITTEKANKTPKVVATPLPPLKP